MSSQALDLTPADVAEAAQSAGVGLFLDDFGNPFASFPCDRPATHRENWPISVKSKSFVRCLRSLLKRSRNWSLRRPLLRETVELLEAAAEERSEIITLSNRVASFEDGILIDRADADWNAIFVNDQGWRPLVLDTPRFRRHRHQMPLPEPTEGGSLDELFTFIPTPDPQHRLLLLTWLVSALVPTVTTPVTALRAAHIEWRIVGMSCPTPVSNSWSSLCRTLADRRLVESCGSG